MKLIDHVYACNSLTDFKYKARAIHENGHGSKSAEIWKKNLAKSHQDNLFGAGFSHIKPLCAAASSAKDARIGVHLNTS